MESGSWEVRVEVAGTQGTGKLAIPVPVFARRTPADGKKHSARAALRTHAVFCRSASYRSQEQPAREGGLAAAEIPSPRNRRIGHIAMAVATVLVVTILAFGNWWWNAQGRRF